MPSLPRKIGRVFGRVHACFSRFRREDSGNLSIEFLIWVPFLTYLATGMFVLSYFMATASEVQQVANEMVRSTISRLDSGETDSQICAALQNEVLPRVVQTMSLVRASRFKPIATSGCQRDGADFLTVTIDYDLSGSALQRLARLIGFSIVQVRRRSVVQL